jgi:guanylate kinase
MRLMIGKLFIISAPSGAGKTTLVNEAIKTCKTHYNLNRVITFTTRPQRPGDIHGVDYYFISKREFEQKIHENYFLEYSCEYGNYYGSPYHIMNDLMMGKSYCMIVDLVGAQALHQKIDSAVFIWIYPKNIEILKERLVKRQSEDIKEIEHRLKLAQNELMSQRHCFEIFNHEILNDDFEIARKNLVDIIRRELAK